MKLCFLIAHKYYRGYDSYIIKYINNINLYHKDSLILIIDNDSKYLSDIEKLITQDNVRILVNKSDSGFELGAYTFGINWLIDNEISEYEYYIFTQDNFILNKKINTEDLRVNNVKACTIYSYHPDGAFDNISDQVLSNLNLLSEMDKITFCWCTSFLVRKDKILQLYDYISKIKIKNRVEGMASERYMARILYELNGKSNFDIDGNIKLIVGGNGYDDSITKYNPTNVEISDNVDVYFLKISQSKTEKTEDKE